MEPRGAVASLGPVRLPRCVLALAVLPCSILPDGATSVPRGVRALAVRAGRPSVTALGGVSLGTLAADWVAAATVSGLVPGVPAVATLRVGLNPGVDVHLEVATSYGLREYLPPEREFDCWVGAPPVQVAGGQALNPAHPLVLQLVQQLLVGHPYQGLGLHAAGDGVETVGERGLYGRPHEGGQPKEARSLAPVIGLD